MTILNNKFIFVNTHLPFGGSGNTKYSERKKMFIDIIKDFNLVHYYKQEYQIFFCGDLNFRILSANNIKKEIEQGSNITNISEKKFYNSLSNKKLSIKSMTNKDELYVFLNTTIKNQNIDINLRNLFHNFLESINETGMHLTCRYFEKKPGKGLSINTNTLLLNQKIHQVQFDNFANNLRINNYNENNIIEIKEYLTSQLNLYKNSEIRNNILSVIIDYKREIEKETNIEQIQKYKKIIKLLLSYLYQTTNIDNKLINFKPCKDLYNCKKIDKAFLKKDTITPRIPSMCDRILYSINKKIIKNTEFIRFNKPSISDHRMIGLLLTIDEDYLNNSRNTNINSIYNNSNNNLNNNSSIYLK